MAEFVIPDVDDAIIQRLEAHATQAGKTLEELVCEILTGAVKLSAEDTVAGSPARHTDQ